MNFAPYQDSDPESARTSFQSSRPLPSKQPPSQPNPPPVPSNSASTYTDADDDDPDDSSNLPDPSSFDPLTSSAQQNQSRLPRILGFGNRRGVDVDDARRNVDLFATSLPMRLDVEAVMAYVALPPAGPAVLLVLEHRSDYVRFHAWQSALLFTFLFLIHLIFSFSKFVSYTLLVLDLVLMAYLSVSAYRGADTLERVEIPWIGRMASGFVDEE